MSPPKYPTMHHFATEMCTHVHSSVTQWCIVGYGTGTLWDLWNISICLTSFQIYGALVTYFIVLMQFIPTLSFTATSSCSGTSSWMAIRYIVYITNNGTSSWMAMRYTLWLNMGRCWCALLWFIVNSLWIRVLYLSIFFTVAPMALRQSWLLSVKWFWKILLKSNDTKIEKPRTMCPFLGICCT